MLYKTTNPVLNAQGLFYTIILNSFQQLFRIRFRNPLELLFHLPLIKQYLIVLFGRVQSLILFALQILFAMLRATSSFGLRPHSTQNSQIRNDKKTIIIKRLSKNPTVMLNLFQHLFTKRFRNKFGMTKRQ